MVKFLPEKSNNWACKYPQWLPGIDLLVLIYNFTMFNKYDEFRYAICEFQRVTSSVAFKQKHSKFKFQKF